MQEMPEDVTGECSGTEGSSYAGITAQMSGDGLFQSLHGSNSADAPEAVTRVLAARHAQNSADASGPSGIPSIDETSTDPDAATSGSSDEAEAAARQFSREDSDDFMLLPPPPLAAYLSSDAKDVGRPAAPLPKFTAPMAVVSPGASGGSVHAVIKRPEARTSEGMDTVDAMLQSDSSTDALADVLSPSAVRTFASDLTSVAGHSTVTEIPTPLLKSSSSSTPQAAPPVATLPRASPPTSDDHVVAIPKTPPESSALRAAPDTEPAPGSSCRGGTAAAAVPFAEL